MKKIIKNVTIKEKCHIDHDKITADTDRVRAIKPTIDSFYKSVNNIRLPIKLYIPQKSKNKHIAVLAIHGGSWYAVTKDSDEWDGSWMNYHAQYYYDKYGYTTAAISYRDINLTEDTNVSELIDDCKAAVNYMKKKCDFDKLIVIGDSAGGHLAIELGFDCDMSVDIVIAANPVLDLLDEKWEHTAKTEEERKAASPAFNVKKCNTKFLVIHGNKDTIVDCKISEKFCNDMSAVGTQCDYIELEGCRHAFVLSRYESTDEMVSKFMNIIDEYIDGIL